MKEKFKIIEVNPGSVRIMISLFGVEAAAGLFVKAKGGNMEHYLSLLLPMLAVSAVAVIFSYYHKINVKFSVFCLILLYIGIAMQCIIQNESRSYGIKEQVILLAAAVGAGGIVLVHDKWIRVWKPEKVLALLGIATVFVYVLLLVFGTESSGTKAWIVVGSFSLQLTEFIKILFIYVNAFIFCCMEWGDCKKILISGIYLCVNLVFSLWISEMGSFLLMLIVYGVYCVLFLKSIRFLLCLFGGIAAAIIMGAGAGAGILRYADGGKSLSPFLEKCCSVVLKIQSRVIIWLHPESDPLGTGYQGMKAREAMVLGGWFGSDHPAKIPVEESDYIFISILLHMGLLVGILIVILFLVLLMEGIRIYLRAESGMNTGIIAGCVYYLFVESMLMILGSTGFFFMTGVPVAFISDGGTALMTSFMMTALILYLGQDKKLKEKEEDKRNGKEKIIRQN